MGEVQYILSTLYNYLTHALRAARPRSTPEGFPGGSGGLREPGCSGATLRR